MGSPDARPVLGKRIRSPNGTLVPEVLLAQSGYAAYDPENGFPFAPVDFDLVVHIRSGGLAEPTAARVDEQGSDIMGTGSTLSPLYSPWGVQVRYGRFSEQGFRILVMIAGGLTQGEMDAGISPWYGQCSSMRQYPIRDLGLGPGGESYVNNFTWVGPQLGAKIEVQPVIGNVSPLMNGPLFTGRSKWRLYNASSYSVSGGGELKGRLLRVMRGGRRVVFETQITGNVRDEVGDAGYLYVDNGNHTTGDGIFEEGDTADIIYPAAEFIPTSRTSGDAGVGGADGIVLTGHGAPNPFGRLVNGANPRPTFSMIGFENLNINGARGVFFDRCDVYHSFNVFDSSIHLRGCTYDGQVTPQVINSQVNVTAATLYDETDEYNGWVAPGSIAPIHPEVGGCALYAYSQSGAAGGFIQKGGLVSTRRGLSIEGGYIVTSSGRLVMPPPGFADPFHARDCIGAGTAALQVKGDSVAIIEPRNFNTSNVTNDLKVGNGAAIDLGDEDGTTPGSFNETAGWNQNFCRYAVTGGFPSGDFSAIRSSEFFE